MGTKVQPYDVIGAVLQQELILCCGKLIETRPELFKGTLVLRMGWIVRALEIYQSYLDVDGENSCLHKGMVTGTLVNLPPHRVRQLLIGMLEDTSGHGEGRRSLQDHQIHTLNGCISRVPENFYPNVFLVLKRCSGLTFRNRHLPQLPTVELVDPSELSFAHLVDSFFTSYSEPRYRGLIIRLLSLLATVLRRNPELSFESELVMEALISEAYSLFLKDQGQENMTGNQPVCPIRGHMVMEAVEIEDLSEFYSQKQSLVDSYLARAIVNLLLGAEIGQIREMECKLQ